MAEAYGKMGDYDYASFTFKQSIDEENLKFPRTNYSLNPDEYLENKIENESFKVTVSKELFELAKTQNPFYLEDENKLKYIDVNDTLTIKCGKEELTFLVEEPEKIAAFEAMDIYPEDGVITISRRILPGKSVIKVNGETLSATAVRGITELLIDIHGQHDHQSLHQQEYH